MKKFLKSFTLSIPLMVLGVVLFSQANNPSFVSFADVQTNSELPIGFILMVSGGILLALGIGSIVYRFIDRD